MAQVGCLNKFKIVACIYTQIKQANKIGLISSAKSWGLVVCFNFFFSLNLIKTKTYLINVPTL